MAIFAVFALAGAANAADLTSIFQRIDAAAKTFKGVTATISKTTHNGLLDDNDMQTGTIKLSRANSGQTRVLADLKGGSTGDRIMSLNGNEALLYNPKTKIVEQRDIGKYKSTIDQYLLLGFGSTSSELKAAYNITYVGDETVGGQPTSHLKLIPKAKGTLKQADLWYGGNGVVVQQKFLQTSGDYQLVTYSDMKLGAVPDKELELKPKGATYQKQEN